MASGSYAYRTRQISMRQQGATFAGTQPSRVPAIVHQSFWLKPWMLYPIGAACVLAVLPFTGGFEPHPLSASFLLTSRGEHYDEQHGCGNVTSTQQKHTDSSPAPTQKP